MTFGNLTPYLRRITGPCYSSPMPGRQGRTTAARRSLGEDIKTLSPEEREAVNRLRPPSERLVDPNSKCGARLKDSPNRKGDHTTCQNKAGEGTDHPGYGNCKFHGGSTKAGKTKAARDYGRDLIALDKARFGGDGSLLTVTAEEAILEEVRRSVAMVRFLEDQIAQWQFGPLSDDPDEQPPLGGLPRLMDETARGASSFTDEREWLMLYREERKHLAQVSSLAIGAGLAERMVRIAESQGQVLATVVRVVLDALALSPEQSALVPQIVPGIIRQVTAGQPVTVQGELVSAQ